MSSHPSATTRALIVAISACAALGLAAPKAAAEALILVEVESGKVLHAENATQPWYPASVTKIMTAYATLRAVKEGKITLDKLIAVSHNAAAQSPVKMGFPVGTTVTVDNAIKMLMVKSANDIAVVLAEGVSGSVENFADLMNRHAQRLGMTQSHFVNPNGLPADEQITSARDMAILARAVIKEFPEYDYYWHLPGIRWGKNVQRNYNSLIGRYPGADGMKTGFICASGFNLVATATRDNKRMIAVVMGASSSSARAIKAAQLLERGFTSNPLSWLTPSLGSVESLTPINAAPPNLREEMCGAHRKRKATEDEDDSAAVASFSSDSAYSVFLSSLRTPNSKANLLQDLKMGEPVLVHTGPKAKQPETRTADTKAGNIKSGNPKNAKKSGGPAVAGAATAPWSSLSPASITNNPPPDLATTQDQGSATPASPEQPKQKAAPKAKAKTAVATQKNATAKKAAPDAKDKDAKKK
jgi:D-alanyl-D-alanine carboxypeptidase